MCKTWLPPLRYFIQNIFNLKKTWEHQPFPAPKHFEWRIFLNPCPKHIYHSLNKRCSSISGKESVYIISQMYSKAKSQILLIDQHPRSYSNSHFRRPEWGFLGQDRFNLSRDKSLTFSERSTYTGRCIAARKCALLTAPACILCSAAGLSPRRGWAVAWGGQKEPVSQTRRSWPLKAVKWLVSSFE